MPRHRRLYLDQVTGWAGAPLLRMKAIETGMHTHRGICVVPLRLTIVELTDAYEPRSIDAYRTREEGLAAARDLMGHPDSRGIIREWLEDEGLPGTKPTI